MDFLEEELEEIFNIFREESEEQIQKINQNLLKLEANPGDGAVIAELFREAHSIKGAARMIGLNDIQSLAHKIEDVFGLAKEGNLKIDAKVIDILCKTVDCIGSIVEKSIETKGAYHSPDVDEIIKQIEDIKQSTTSKKKKKNELKTIDEKIDKSIDKPYEPFCKKNADLISKIKKSLKELKECSSDTSVISELCKLISEMDNVVQATDNTYEIKELIQDIKVKLDGVVKGSGILIEVEIDEINEVFDSFMRNFDTELNTLKSNKRFNNKKQVKQETGKNQEDNDELKSNLDYISKNIILLNAEASGTSKIIATIIDKLKNSINTSVVIKEEVRKIFEKVLELVLFSKENNVKPNSEITEVIKQSFDTAVQMITNDITEDPNLIVQRLAILHQILKLSEPEEKSKKEQKTNLSPIRQKTEILPKGEIPLSKDINDDNYNKSTENTFENTAIKTLRVDTKKLDQLVSQIGELIIAKIKTKERLSEIEKIIRAIEDWYRELNKSRRFFRHLEKKPLKPNEMPSGTSSYSQNKSAYAFFEDSSARISNFKNQMSILYKSIQEDDAKLNLIVNELEERIKSIRVLPLATIFHMFPRMVRDIAREGNKDIELIISGSETSVDKKIIEEIKSPLIHIIRNAIDHGIEKPEIRIKNNKNPVGKIFLSAYHLENSVLIEIIDDGKGIDLESIKRKVLQKGLLTQAELKAMNDEQIMNIIFWPGFSTGEVVTDISGRGVGLDIVYTKITQLNGKVNIKSTIGEGCKVSVQLPVTMATIKSFLVSVNNQTFAIPTNAIKTALLIKPEDIFYKEGKETIIVDNKTVPIYKLSGILELPDQKNNENKIIVIIIQAEEMQVGFIIDKLLGDQEILHKNLTAPLLRVRNVAGVTTLGSGELCLILNINDLIKSACLNSGINKKQLIVKEKTENIKRNVLVVDDSVTTRILERNILRAAGYSVVVAVNGLDALTKILNDKFDLIVTDVEMPEINGFELTERLRQDDKFKDIPIILVTSLASEIDQKKGLELGANAYITKGDFNQEKLLSTVKKLIG
ncbi:MAG: hybrid sensor histidine kinase/response regulator [bacterium]